MKDQIARTYIELMYQSTRKKNYMYRGINTLLERPLNHYIKKEDIKKALYELSRNETEEIDYGKIIHKAS